VRYRKPWRLGQEYASSVEIVDADDNIVVEVINWDGDLTAEDRNIANMLCAAPETRDMLDSILRHLERAQDNLFRLGAINAVALEHDIANARAAIAKSMGNKAAS
jgi:hypothetical protein